MLICLLTLVGSDFMGTWRSAVGAKIKVKKRAKMQGFDQDLEKNDL